MTVSEVIRVGDKIEIRVAQEVEQVAGIRETVRMYKSQVLDKRANGNLLISMPSEGGKLMLLPLGIRYEFVFYSMGSLYRTIGQIRERFKKDNIYMLEIELRSGLEKLQRREFFRYPCILEFEYYKIPEEAVELETVEQIYDTIRDDYLAGNTIAGRVMDLSGGGIRFSTEESLEPDTNLLLELQLSNESIDKQYHIVARVISCDLMEKLQEKRFEVRAKFFIRDDKVREEIIHYIFEEERKTRQRGK